MHQRTLATLEQLEKPQWFTHVGERDTDVAIVLDSWEAAIAHCSSLDWQNLCLEAANQYRLRLFERSKERFERWNDIAIELKRTPIPFVQRKIKPAMDKNNLPKVFEDMVQWDVLGVCMEAEYADVYPPGYYASQCYWYTMGHFSCGWEGQFPEGQLIIY